MRVLHLAYDYGLKGLSGAPIAATRLHLALIRAGVDSHFVCVNSVESGPNVHVLPSTRIGRKFFYFITRSLWVFMRIFFGKMYMPNLIPLPGLNKLLKKLKPDIIHAHFIYQDLVSFHQLTQFNGKFVITLHDLLAVNAVDPYPGDDRRFIEGFEKANSQWMERVIFKRKQKFIDSIRPIFTGPSNWVCEVASESIIGKNHKICKINNIVDPIYAYNFNLRKKNDGRFVILFGAFGGRRSGFKGWPDLEAALKLLPKTIAEHIQVNIFGETAKDYVINGINIHFLGPINTAEALRNEHHQADIFALPSRQDNAPQVKFEALLDGLPVLAFKRTGCAEYIRHQENGWVAADGDIVSFAHGIEYFYQLYAENKLDQLHIAISDFAKKEFSETKILNEMMQLYQN